LSHVGGGGDVIAQNGIVTAQIARDQPFAVFEVAVLLAGDAGDGGAGESGVKVICTLLPDIRNSSGPWP